MQKLNGIYEGVNGMEQNHHENVVPNLRNGVRFYYSDEPFTNYIPFHWHNSLEVVCVIKGNLRFTLDGHELAVGPREFAMVPSGAIHEVASTPNCSLVLQIPLHAVRPFYENPEAASFRNGRTEYREYREIVELLNAMYEILESPGEGAWFDFEIYLLKVLKHMFTKFRAPNDNTRGAEDVKEIITYLHEHIHESILVSDLADLFGYSPSYLSRMFKQRTGISLVQYMYEVKVNRLHDDLLNTDESIKALTEKYALNNSRMTREVFKRQYGMLPKDVRKQRTSNPGETS